MKYIYGPVHSRRLGRSLGIDPIPLKTCNWNCVYCQLGRTVPMTNARREYVPTAEIEGELACWLAINDSAEIDWISIVGSGEPTLHAGIDRLVLAVKRLTDVPLAVITNGSLLYLPEVREALRSADAVMPTLAAATKSGHRRLHRPHPQATVKRQIDGLITFRNEYEGKLLVEVMLVAGLNDGEETLRALAKVLAQIRPDGIHITTPVRPPAEPWVRPPGKTALRRACQLLEQICEVDYPLEETNQSPYLHDEDFLDKIINLLKRHPLSETEFERLLASEEVEHPENVKTALIDSGRVQRVKRGKVSFLVSPESRYPPEKATPPAEH